MSDDDLIRRGDALNVLRPYGSLVDLIDRTAALPAVSAPVAVRPSDPAHIVEYTNYRGETARRCIIPIRMWWGKTEWHQEEQWMLTAWDVEKNAGRDFAWQDMRPVQNPATSAARIIAAIDAPDVAELVEALRKVPSALNRAFAAGMEEREGGSARRQAKELEHVEALRAEIRAILAKIEGQ